MDNNSIFESACNDITTVSLSKCVKNLYDFQSQIGVYVYKTHEGLEYTILFNSNIDLPVIITSSGDHVDVFKIIHYDLVLDNSWNFDHLSNEEVWCKMVDDCWNLVVKQTSDFHLNYCKLLAKQSNSCVFPVSNELITSVQIMVNNLTVMLCQNFDAFERLRQEIIQNKNESSVSLKRNIKNWSESSISFFYGANRSDYNNIILNYLSQVHKFRPTIFSIHPSTTASYSRLSGKLPFFTKPIVCEDKILHFKVPVETIFTTHVSHVPFIKYGALKSAILYFPENCIVQSELKFKLNGSFMVEFFRNVVQEYANFTITFTSTHFYITPKKMNKFGSIVIPKDTQIECDFSSLLCVNSLFSCLDCHNYNEHTQKCSQKKKYNFVNESPIACMSVNVKNFKDSPNLVRSATLSKIQAIMTLCNVTYCKYSEKQSNINPLVFINAYNDYTRNTSINIEYSFEDFVKLYTENKVLYVNNNDTATQVNIFSKLDADISKLVKNIGETDRCFVYIGLPHNIKRASEFLKNLEIFCYPENCPIELNYIFYGKEINSISVNHSQTYRLWDHQNTVRNECLDEVVWKHELPLKICKDFKYSSAPFCTHNEIIQSSCHKCFEQAFKFSRYWSWLFTMYGIKYDQDHPSFLPIAEKCSTLVPILIKPNGLVGENLSLLVSCLRKYESGITLDTVSSPETIPNRMFDALYPSCSGTKRRFGKHWSNYMKHKPCMLLILRTNGSYDQVRLACLEARKKSNIEWTKNIVHSAETDDEMDLFWNCIAQCKKNNELNFITPINYDDSFPNFIKSFINHTQPSFDFDSATKRQKI
jgi:hypothetical protein